MTSRVSLTSTSVLWVVFCVGSCSMIPSYDMRARCNETIDMKKENTHLGEIVFNMTLHRTIAEDTMSCSVDIVPWFSKPNIQYYFSEMNLPRCDNSRLEIRKSADGDSYRYPNDFVGTKCGDNVTRKLVDKEHTVTGSYLKILLTWSKEASLTTSFTMIFNTYGTGDCEGNNEHLCDNERCIVKNITCMKYNTCGDQSDCGSKDDAQNWVIFGIIFVVWTFLMIILTKAIFNERCRDLLRDGCDSCERRGGQEVRETGTTGSLPRPSPELQTRFSSISHTYEYGDHRQPEVESTELEINDVIEMDVHDPPPPYTDDFRRNRDRPLPSLPPREEFEELPPPPPHYDEVMGQPDRYMTR